MPTLVTVGELDVLVPLAASEELAAAIPGAELVVFEGAGHLASIERGRSVQRGHALVAAPGVAPARRVRPA